MEQTPQTLVEPFAVLRHQLADPATSWTIGTFGALAEFFHDPAQPITIHETTAGVFVCSALGAIQIKPHAALHLIPYEGLSSLANAWTQGLLVCLPIETAYLSNRTGICEISTDGGCLKPASGSEILFDLGLGIPHLDFCIRTSDPNLISILRTHLGRSVFSDGMYLLGAIQAASPTRVIATQVARIEIYQAIPPDGSETPLGPRTHLSQKLLQMNRTQAATIPVPDGLVPVLAFYPPNPVRHETGTLRAFDAEAHIHFQSLLEMFGPTDLVRIKKAFRNAMGASREPSEGISPQSKHQRTALRVAIRQHHHTHGSSELLHRWQQAYEPRQ